MTSVIFLSPLKQKKRGQKTTDYYDFFNKPPRVDIDTSPLFDNRFIMKKKSSPYILILDTETSDLTDKYGTPSLPVSISWLLLDENLNVLNEKEYTLRQQQLSDNAVMIHKITPKMQEKGISPLIAIEELKKDLRNISIIVAHNIEFHLSVVKLQINTLGLPFDDIENKKIFCTMQWATNNNITSYREQPKYPSLTELFGRLYFNRNDVEISFKSKSRRDIMLVSACLRNIKYNTRM